MSRPWRLSCVENTFVLIITFHNIFIGVWDCLGQRYWTGGVGVWLGWVRAGFLEVINFR